MKDKEIDEIMENIFTDENLQKVRNALENMNKFQTGYFILMDYWDILPDDEKENIDQKLKELGL